MPSKKRLKSAEIKTLSTHQDLLKQAEQALATNQFKNAIELFKKLLKLETKSEYSIGLAKAYSGRAQELYAKGMVKEAILIWDNRCQLCPQAPIDLEYIKVLLYHGNIKTALQIFHANKEQLDNEKLTAIQPHIAKLYLADVAMITDDMPAEDPVLIHGSAAKTALIAYCNGEYETVEFALAKIPFRSPYRDFARIIKALMKFNSDDPGAIQLLKQVSSDSAFAPFKRAVELALLPTSEFYSQLWETKPSISIIATKLRGWSDMRIELWLEIQALGQQPKIQMIEQFIYKHRQLFGLEWARQQGLKLLQEDFPHSIKRSPFFSKKNNITKLEKSLVMAWSSRGHNEINSVLEAWRAV
ncbi:hypothetical protein TI03_05225, partial [Achromatium sp. WMS1]